MPTRLTPEEFVRRLAQRFPRIEALSDYVTAKEKISLRCKACSHEWQATPDNLLRGVKYGCPKCALAARSKEWKAEIRKWLRKHRPDVKLIGELTTHGGKTLFQCTDEQCLHKWETTFRSLKTAATGCPQCAIRRNAESKRLPEDEFRKWLKENRPFVHLLEYTSQSEPATFRCLNPNHESSFREWTTIPEVIRLQGRGLQGCPDCGWTANGKQFLVPEQEKRQWMEENKPSIRMGNDYIDTKTPCTFSCLVCEYEWKTSVAVFTNNDAGCPRCSGVARVTEEDFLERLEKVSKGGIKMIGAYHGYGHKTQFQCQLPSCLHIWSIQPVRLTCSSPTGCPSCTPVGFNQGKDAWLYLMARPGEQQIGITNVPVSRLSTHRRDGWTLLELRGPAPGSMVLEVESALKRWLSSNFDLVEGRRENWSTVDLRVDSLNELASMASISLSTLGSRQKIDF